MMIKPVPDPPRTAHPLSPPCHAPPPPLFAVCEGASLEDALVHLNLSLASAYETNYQLCESGGKPVQGLAWATQHALEISQALVESLLKGVRQSQA